MANKNEERKVAVELVDLKKYFPVKSQTLFGETESVKANDGVSFKIYEGETFGLVGESGCGKTTLGRTILRLEEPTDGHIYFEGRDITRIPQRRMRPLRTQMQIIFQDPYSSLDPKQTVGQIIGEALLAHKMYKKRGDELENYILDVMEKCGLDDYMIHRYPHQFSGGQRQRIGIARSLALNPKFVVCDEAVSALDVSIQSQILNLLRKLKREENLTYLFISHDLSVVKHLSDRIGVMYLGEMVELGGAEEVHKKSLHPYTKALLSAVPTTEAGSGKDKIILKGDIPSNVRPPSGCRFHTRCPLATEKCRQEIPKWEEVEEGHFVACHHHEQTKTLGKKT